MSANLKKGVFSSVLLVIDSLAQKLVGLASTLVLARVLLPEDFGIIAIASLMIGFIEIFSTTGSGQYLMRVDNLDEDKVNTAWTINMAIKSTMSLIMLFASFFIADLYGDPRLTPILVTLTLVFFITSFQNPGLAFLKRQQNYSKIVKLTIITKVLSAIIAVSAALILKNYWALVIGKAVSALCMVFGSYIIQKHEPKLMLSNASEQWQFSGWMIPQALFGYCRSHLDTFIVSSAFGQSVLGSYYTMKYIAYIPSSQIIVPIGQPFLVEFANSKNSISYFSKQLKTSFILLMMIALPMSGIMFDHHSLITSFLLGDNWVEYSFLLAAFGLLIPAFVLKQQSSRILMVFAKTKLLFFIEIIIFIIVYGALFLNGMTEIKSFTFLFAVMECITAVGIFVYVLHQHIGFKRTVSLGVSVLPLVAGFIIGRLFSFSLIEYFPSNVFLQLVFITGSFCFGFLITIWFCYFFGFKKFSEWAYLSSLLLRVLNPAFVKFRNIKWQKR